MMSALRVGDRTKVRLLALAQTLRADSTRESTVLRGRSRVYRPMLQQQQGNVMLCSQGLMNVILKAGIHSLYSSSLKKMMDSTTLKQSEVLFKGQ